MSATNIYPAVPSSYSGTYYIDQPTVGWSVTGDNNPSTCIATASDSKQIYVDLYASWDPGSNYPYSSFGLGSIPTYITISAMTMYWLENRSGTGTGSWKGQHSLDGSSWTDNIAAHQVQASTLQSGSMSRPGGGSWTRTDLTNLRVRCTPTAAGTTSRNCFIDHWYVTVTWDYITLLSLTSSSSSVTSDSAVLSGSYNANGDGDTEYRLTYKISGGSYDTPAWTAGVGTGSITCTNRNLSGLSPSTLYYYRLEARNSADTVQYSAEGSFTTSAAATTKASRLAVSF